jgi:hypothetical protein
MPRKIMPHGTAQVFGEWIYDSQPPTALHADRILGARISYDGAGRPEWVDLQWQDQAGAEYCQVQIDFPNAMFLLSLLKSIQLETGTPFPDDPRAPR